MKKRLILLLVLMLLLSVFPGCGKDTSTLSQIFGADINNNVSGEGDQNNPTNTFPFTKPAEPQLVAGPISTENAIEAPANAVPELSVWANGSATADKLYDRGTTCINYNVSASVMMEYIDALQDNGFTLVDEYEQSYKDTFRSWAFTCDAVPNAQSIEMQYEKTPCHICIWMAKNDSKYCIDISPSLQFFDTGLRQGDAMAKRIIAGPSAGEGLLRMSDGSYQTTDGRLTAFTGTARVIRDGKSYTCDARWKTDNEDECLWVEDYYRNEGFFFQVPKSSLMEGDILLANDLIRERYYTTEKESLEAYNWKTPFFALAYNGMWKGPEMNGNDYESLTVRIMYYQKGGDAVYYVYAKLRNAEPSEVEALVAVDMSHSSGGSFGDATRIQVGQTVELHYTGTEFNTHYDVYEWSVTDGVGNVSISGVESNCQVTALDKGIATVTVTYRYSVDEPHILTGIPSATPKSKTQSYNFIIE